MLAAYMLTALKNGSLNDLFISSGKIQYMHKINGSMLVFVCVPIHAYLMAYKRNFNTPILHVIATLANLKNNRHTLQYYE